MSERRRMRLGAWSAWSAWVPVVLVPGVLWGAGDLGAWHLGAVVLLGPPMHWDREQHVSRPQLSDALGKLAG
jgi:hypothetical protein